jgi:hypothetical protein
MNDDFEEIEKLLELPEHFDELKKAVSKLEATINSNGIDQIRLNVFQAASKAAEIHLSPLSASAAILDRAKLAMDEASRRSLFRRRWLWALGIGTAVLLALVSGVVLGRSPSLTVAAIKSEVGCDLFGGRWVAAQRVNACAFEVKRQR